MGSMLRQGKNNYSPIEGKKMFITDGGLETTLIFHHGLELPHFAAFDIIKSQEGHEIILDYYKNYAKLARKYQMNFILESPTWRANPDWGKVLGYNLAALDHVNRQSIEMMRAIKLSYEEEGSNFLISGCIGPRGDGYNVESKMTARQAFEYHQHQISSFAKAEVDMVTGVTMTYLEEALGIVQAATKFKLPVVISFTLETNGNLPSGQGLKEAISQIDQETMATPVYYMINCAHPSHFLHILNDEMWVNRIQGIRANASIKSHEELDEATELDEGNPTELSEDYLALTSKLKNLKVIGGCCGTDHRHIDAICNRLF